MLAEKKTATNIGVGVGILLQLVGASVQRTADGGTLAMIGSIIVLIGLAVFIWGCCNYAEGKGYHAALGLLGLLSCLGLIILVVLPDKHRS